VWGLEKIPKLLEGVELWTTLCDRGWPMLENLPSMIHKSLERICACII
jgi:hypothetical protein